LDRTAIRVARIADEGERVVAMCRIHEGTEELPQGGPTANRVAQCDVFEPCIFSVQLDKAGGFGAAEPAKPVSCPCVVHDLAPDYPTGGFYAGSSLVRPNSNYPELR